LPPGIAPRPVEPPPIVPSAEPDAALASMAQRLEAALRRPAPPEGGAAPQPAAHPQELTGSEPPPTAPDEPARPTEPKGAKPKSVLDSLEEEMASLLGRPPEKQ
jgi:hypothetical protein